MSNGELLTEEEKQECARKAHAKMLVLTRVIVSVILLAFVCLAWYGAEMLLYGYSQPSIVDAIVAVWLVTMISGRMMKEMIINDRKRELARGILKGIAKATEKENTEGKSGDSR